MVSQEFPRGSVLRIARDCRLLPLDGLLIKGNGSLGLPFIIQKVCQVVQRPAQFMKVNGIVRKLANQLFANSHGPKIGGFGLSALLEGFQNNAKVIAGGGQLLAISGYSG